MRLQALKEFNKVFQNEKIRKAESRTIVICPHLTGSRPNSDNESFIPPEVRLEEIYGLAQAIKLEVQEKLIIRLRSITPATYIGSGKVAELRDMVAKDKIRLVILDCALSPVQQRNLEKSWNCKVIDRTALILEIFGERAKTREGALQVELASLEYQKGRLVRSWTHLERQRGGFGFLGGPGERQIESDRRQINERIRQIKKELDVVRKTRSLHRKSRKKVPYPIIALVGYTNAGKSTLFNKLTGAGVRAEDLLFATLDPTMRIVTLPSKRKVILSDTVGFISNLPTELVAAFRATLEEVVEADLILHVRDISSSETKAQKESVEKILVNLGLQEKIASGGMIEVLNKIDQIPDNKFKVQDSKIIYISALIGEGCDILLKRIDDYFSAKQNVIKIDIDAANGKLLSWIYNHGENVRSKTEGDVIHIEAELSDKNVKYLEKSVWSDFSLSDYKP